jgi:plastocyanin
MKETMGTTTGVSKAAIGAIAILVVGVVAIGAYYVTGTGSNSCSTPAASSTQSPNAIHLSEYSGPSNSANPPGYKPDAITVVVGVNNTVTWTNDDSAAHTVTLTSGPAGVCFDSGNMGPGASYTITFTTLGTYNYDCRYHSWMTGTMIVKAS